MSDASGNPALYIARYRLAVVFAAAGYHDDIKIMADDLFATVAENHFRSLIEK
jgi:hypothetical protein